MNSGFKKFIWASIVFHITVAVAAIASSHIGGFWPRQTEELHTIHLVKGTDEKPSANPYKKANGMPNSTIRDQDKPKVKDPDPKGKNTTTQQGNQKPKTKEVVNNQTTPPKPTTPKAPVKDETDDITEKYKQQLAARDNPIEAAQVPEEGTGQSPEGDLNEKTSEADAVLASYYSQIKKQVNAQWIMTERTNDGTALITQIQVLIDAEGKIISAEYRQKSVDVSFDLSAMRAVERAAPFPLPPDAIKERVLTKGFILEFNPTSVGGTI